VFLPLDEEAMEPAAKGSNNTNGMPEDQSFPTLTKRQRIARLGRYGLPLLLLGVAVHLVLPQMTALEHSLQVVKRMALWAMALAVGLQLLSYLGSGYLLRAIATMAGNQLSLLRGTMIFAAAASVGLVGGGPVGNAAVTYRWMRGSGAGREGAVLAGWLPSLLSSAILVLIGILGVAHLLVVHDLSTVQAVGFGLTLALLSLIAGVVLWAVHHRSRLSALAASVAKHWAMLRRKAYDPAPAQAAVGRLFSAWDALRSGGWRGLIAGAAANIAFDIGTLYLLFVAAGHPVSAGILLAGYGLPLLLGKVSFLPGGVGIVEGTMAALYNGLGVPNAVTVVVILAYRLISFWLPTLVGFPLVPYLQRATRAQPAKAEHDRGSESLA
jgi:uncharacterized protein (TIRG00374 family)